MTDPASAVTKVAQDLTAILDLAATLDDQAPHPDTDPCPNCEDDNWSLSDCHYCGCPNTDHNDPFIGGCTRCGDCEGWL